MEERDLIDAGLYDPTAPDAAPRLELLELLVGHGATIDQMVAAAASGRLASLAGDLIAHPAHERLSLEQAAERVGLTPERVRRILLAAGLSVDVADPYPLTSADLDAIATFEVGVAVIGEEQALAFTRLLGNAAQRVAEAAVEIFAVQAAARVAVQGSSEVDHGQASVDAMELTKAVPAAFGDLLHQHLRRSVRRALVTAMENEPDAIHTTVGFVDLVGSTAWTRELSNAELSRALVQFEAAAFDIATEHGGWVVKLIGDAAMFEVSDPAAACRIALDLCAAVEACPDLPGARGGLASGVVQARDGDYFGTTVNLAARAAAAADPASVAVNGAVADHLAHHAPPHWRIDPMPSTPLHGFDDPPPLFRLTAAVAPTTPK